MKISAITNLDNTLLNHEEVGENISAPNLISLHKDIKTKEDIIDFIQTDKSRQRHSALIRTPVSEIKDPVINKRLYIKNMVSIRCKMIVRSELAKIGIQNPVVQLGEVEIKEDLSQADYDKFNVALKKFGLELLNDWRSILVEKIKNIIVETIHYSEELPQIKFSDYLSKKLNYNYTYLSNLFSEVKGTSIEHFIIIHKIERVKELLVYNELTLKEITGKLQYSSVAHLSNQFKKVTGLTPIFFKRMKHKKLINLDDL